MFVFLLLLSCSSSTIEQEPQRIAPPPLSAHYIKPTKEISISAGGDIMFGRYRGSSYIPVGGDNPFLHLTPKFKSTDISIVNLETPITDSVASGTSLTAQRGLLFRAPSSVMSLLEKSNITVLSRANNHAEDRFEIGLRETEQYLDEAGIFHTGVALQGKDAFAPLHLDINDVHIILFAFTMRRNLGLPKEGKHLPVAFSFDPNAKDELPPRIKAIRQQNPQALILISAHWGEEYTAEPTKTVRELAHALIDAGADGILGHHPHVLQPVELYKESPILYSMGNLIFDQTALPRRQTAIFSLSFSFFQKWKVSAIQIHPMLITDKDHGPRDTTIGEANAFLPDLLSLSQKYNINFHRTEKGAIWNLPSAETMSSSPITPVD